MGFDIGSGELSGFSTGTGTTSTTAKKKLSINTLAGLNNAAGTSLDDLIAAQNGSGAGSSQTQTSIDAGDLQQGAGVGNALPAAVTDPAADPAADPTADPTADPATLPNSPGDPGAGNPTAPSGALEMPVYNWQPDAFEMGPVDTSELDKFYQDMLSSRQQGWQSEQEAIGANSAAMERRMAAINAAMGRSVGGAFVSGGLQNAANTRRDISSSSSRLAQDKADIGLKQFGARTDLRNTARQNAWDEYTSTQGAKQHAADKQFDADMAAYRDLLGLEADAALVPEDEFNYGDLADSMQLAGYNMEGDAQGIVTSFLSDFTAENGRRPTQAEVIKHLQDQGYTLL